MKLTYLGHACFMVTVNGKHLLFDPFVRPNPLASEIDIDKIEADYILISHGHADHIADAADIASRTGATIIAAFEITNWLQQQGIEKVHGMNIGGKWRFDFGTVKCVVAQHSSVLPDGTYGGNPMGFIVKAPEGAFYYSGDTALTYDMKLVGEFEKPNFALLPIGSNFTMGVDDAVRAAQWAGVKKVVGLHFDTFGYIVINHEEAKAKFAAADIELILLGIGDSISIS